MKRAWFILLALSLGLNAGLLYVVIAARARQAALLTEFGNRQGRGGPRWEEGRHPGGRELDPEGLTRRHLRRMSKRLDLDEQQRQAIAEVMHDYLPRIVEQRRKLHEIRQKIGLQFAVPALDPMGFRTAVERLNQEQARLDSLVMESMLAEAALLTPEQRSRYAETLPWGPPPRRGGRPR
jgi:Spy/CpxP family protein refolding chaperone